MAIDEEKLGKLCIALGDLSVSLDDAPKDKESLEWVFDNYEIDPDKLLEAIEEVFSLVGCLEALEDLRDEEAEAEG